MRISLLLISFITAFNASATEIKAKVIKVLDGDTIDVIADYLPANLLVTQIPQRVRLLNIDAPEKGQAFGRWSGEQLKTLVAGKFVIVNYDSSDRYGRLLGRVSVNGIDINHQMISVGAAWVYDQYNADTALPALQKEAQEQRRGLWAESNPIPPWEWRHRKN
ncbi:thermonuclease family protein [Pantoea stewartii]|uniref:Micrococcal nuclease n=1 Tax=Pantoea stewartii subsp. stewartii DC283 TaxID=660596 RepID=A0ABN4Z5L1_PANSE|nr:thermonuclease family protein [Pantoea stewartii]ARF52087.1 micrococcal nuclease [Pantoea stewartii subsp. stewartii DC283]KAB0545973.1 thermonuclease family protein [Pantoea stewartii subsp. stewartii]